MTKLKEPQISNLNEFLDKCTIIAESLERAKNMSSYSRENVEWYCKYLIKKYYDLYVSDIIKMDDYGNVDYPNK